jgi:hypothetical protein
MNAKYFPILMTLILTTPLAQAGTVNPVSVTVDPVQRYADGDQWTARSSENDLEYIGCGVRKFDDAAAGAFAFGFCQARDAAGVEAFCNTDNEDLLDVIEAASDFSYLTFSWDEAGTCVRIGSSTQSLYLPDFKQKK